MFKNFLSQLGVYKLYEKWLWFQVKNGKEIKHIAIILDGNRRWADHQNRDLWIGHQEGVKKVDSLIEWCLKLGVKSLTLYAFSTDNFKRPKNQVTDLMSMFINRFRKLLEDESLHNHKIRIKVIGRLSEIPEELQQLIKIIEKKTETYDNLILNIALAYHGRAEILDATRKIAEKVLSGELLVKNVNEQTFEKFLYTAHMGNQDPELILRTSGEERLSGFLLWQSAYSELSFLDVYWPDFRFIDLLRAIRTFQKRKRRFGK